MKNTKPDVPIIRIVSPLACLSLDVAASDRVIPESDIETRLPDALNTFVACVRWFFVVG